MLSFFPDQRPNFQMCRELQAIENGEVEDNRTGPNSLDKERSLLNDDPKWMDTTYVLANYKTEPCKKPPRLCRWDLCWKYRDEREMQRENYKGEGVRTKVKRFEMVNNMVVPSMGWKRTLVWRPGSENV